MSVDLPERHVLNLVNISEGGLQFSSPKPLKQNQIINLVVNLTKTEAQIEALAQVTWIKKLSEKHSNIYRVGVTFLGISQEAAQKIQDFLKPRLRAA